MNAKRLSMLFVAAALAAGVVAGCGDDDEDTTTPTVQTTVPTTAPTTSVGTEETTAPPATAPGGEGGNVSIPELVGVSVKEAQASLLKLGLAGRAESLTGSRTEIKPDWEVCATYPASGKSVDAASSVTLVSAKPGGC